MQMREVNFTVSEYIRGNLNVLARKVVEKQFQQNPEYWDRYGDAGFDRCIQDTEHHLAYLAEAIGLSSVRLWLDYVQWATILLKSFRVDEDDFAANLSATRVVLQMRLLPEAMAIVTGFIDEGIDQIYVTPSTLPPFIDTDTPTGLLASRYLSALLYAHKDKAFQTMNEAAEAGMSVEDLYLNVLQPVQYEVGRLWQESKITVAHEHFCTSASQQLMSQLLTRFPSSPRTGKSLVSACVSGELHDMGLRMVSDYFSIMGWETYHLGANTPTKSLLSLLLERPPDVLALSVTITTHLSTLREVMTAVRAQEALLATKILVGGYPFNVSPRLWREIGADGYAPDSTRALQVAQELVQSVP